jgi:hypothetical protein
MFERKRVFDSLALKLLRLLVQLGVERNYATVGIFKLGVQSGQFLLPHV